MSVIITEYDKAIDPSVLREPIFELYCGAILNTDRGYCNYPLNDLITLGDPTDDNYSKYYMIRDFLQYSPNIKIMRPINTDNIGNVELTFDSNLTPVLDGIKNCYNPTVANNTIVGLTFPEKLKIISRNVIDYSDNTTYAFSICSTLANFDEKIFTDDVSEFGTSLINSDSELKTYQEIAQRQPNFASNEFCIVILIKTQDGLYELLKADILNYDIDYYNSVDSVEFDEFYITVGDSVDVVDTFNQSVTDCDFENYSDGGVSTFDFSLTETDYKNTLQVLKSESDLKGVLSFEFDGNMNIVAEVFTDSDVINFVSPFSVDRYFSLDDKTQALIDDFKVNNTSDYFNEHRNNTCIIANMYRFYDELNITNRWLPVSGLYAGLYFQKELIKPIKPLDYIPNYKLMYNPGSDDRKKLLNNLINTIVINYQKDNSVYGNRIINDNLVIKDVYNIGIVELLKYKLHQIVIKYNTLFKSKEVNVKKEQIYNDIEIILKSMYESISTDSINYYYESNTLKYTITIILKDLVDIFVVDLVFLSGE